MNRIEAIEIIVKSQIINLSATEREDILIDGWWQMDDEDEEFRYLPSEVRQSILNTETPPDPENPAYDSMILKRLAGKYHGVQNSYIADIVSELRGCDTAVTGEVEPRTKCPCCGFLTLPIDPEWDICPVCFWEYTGGDPDQYSGPNHMTLNEGRANFVALGASAQRRVQLVDKDGPLKFEKG